MDSVHGNITSVDWAQVLNAGCNQFRVHTDIDCSAASLFEIVDWMGSNAGDMAAIHGPGHFMDADQLIIGNQCISAAEERAQMALWAVLAQPLFASVDFRNISAASSEILLNTAALAVDQDALGQMGARLDNVSAPTQRWVRNLADGSVAVALLNRHGGAVPPCPPSAFAVTTDGYNETISGQCGGFQGLTLAQAEAACCADETCAGFSFSNRSGGIGQGCFKPDGRGGFVNSTQYIGVFKKTFPPPTPPPAADITIAFADVSLRSPVRVFDIWAQRDVGVFTDSYTAAEVPFHDVAFLRLTSLAES